TLRQVARCARSRGGVVPLATTHPGAALLLNLALASPLLAPAVAWAAPDAGVEGRADARAADAGALDAGGAALAVAEPPPPPAPPPSLRVPIVPPLPAVEPDPAVA